MASMAEKRMKNKEENTCKEKPHVGNLHMRFDAGKVTLATPRRRGWTAVSLKIDGTGTHRSSGATARTRSTAQARIAAGSAMSTGRAAYRRGSMNEAEENVKLGELDAREQSSDRQREMR